MQLHFLGQLDVEARVITKSFAQLTEVYDLQKKDKLNVSHGCLSGKHFEDHELLNKCEESKYSRQEEPYDSHIFAAKRRAVEPEIHSKGLGTRSDRTEIGETFLKTRASIVQV